MIYLLRKVDTIGMLQRQEIKMDDIRVEQVYFYLIQCGFFKCVDGNWKIVLGFVRKIFKVQLFSDILYVGL